MSALASLAAVAAEETAADQAAALAAAAAPPPAHASAPTPLQRLPSVASAPAPATAAVSPAASLLLLGLRQLSDQAHVRPAASAATHAAPAFSDMFAALHGQQAAARCAAGAAAASAANPLRAALDVLGPRRLSSVSASLNPYSLLSDVGGGGGGGGGSGEGGARARNGALAARLGAARRTEPAGASPHGCGSPASPCSSPSGGGRCRNIPGVPACVPPALLSPVLKGPHDMREGDPQASSQSRRVLGNGGVLMVAFIVRRQASRAAEACRGHAAELLSVCRSREAVSKGAYRSGWCRGMQGRQNCLIGALASLPAGRRAEALSRIARVQRKCAAKQRRYVSAAAQARQPRCRRAGGRRRRALFPV